MAIRQRIVRRLVTVVLAGVLASGCVMNRAKGKAEFSLVSQEQELAMGKAGDKDIRLQYGAYDHAAVSAYVQRVGEAVARHSDNPELAWHFLVLDSPVVNAFALPGGYIYVTRGLLAYLENEAQLAVVLGHEIGHVTARHTAGQITRQNLAGFGLGLSALFLPDLRPYMGLLQTGMQLLFLRYSRDDESQADALGVTYATRAGYDAAEGAPFFKVLKALDTQQTGGVLPTWASTHPDPAERQARVEALAAAANQGLPRPATGGRDSGAFLGKLKTLVFGQDPRQGYVKDGYFIHPGMAFKFPIPAMWTVGNYPAKVELLPPDERLNAKVILTGAPGKTPEEAAEAFLKGTGATVLSVSPATLHGLPAYTMQCRLAVQADQGTLLLQIGGVFIQKGDKILALYGYAPANAFGYLGHVLEEVVNGFTPVTDKALLNVQPKRVDVVSAPKTGPFQAVIPVPSGSKLSLDDLAILNQRDRGTAVTKGTPLKVIR